MTDVTIDSKRLEALQQSENEWVAIATFLTQNRYDGYDSLLAAVQASVDKARNTAPTEQSLAAIRVLDGLGYAFDHTRGEYVEPGDVERLPVPRPSADAVAMARSGKLPIWNTGDRYEHVETGEQVAVLYGPRRAVNVYFVGLPDGKRRAYRSDDFHMLFMPIELKPGHGRRGSAGVLRALVQALREYAAARDSSWHANEGSKIVALLERLTLYRSEPRDTVDQAIAEMTLEEDTTT